MASKDTASFDEIRRLGTPLADLEKYLFSTVGPTFAKSGVMSDFDFFAIVTWKSNRSKTKVRKGLNRSAEEVMRAVHTKTDDRGRLEKLIEIGGIGIPIASAVLTVCYPDRFTVLDYRAWETLRELGRVTAVRMPTRPEGYFDTYLKACQALAHENSMTLRELDHALWGWSLRKDILKAAGP
jgi:thermostable 8-oxoguanine DNA glycosylase